MNKKFCYFSFNCHNNYDQSDFAYEFLASNKIFYKKFSYYWHVAFLSDSDISYLRLAINNIQILHEGAKLDKVLCHSNKMEYLPKNLEIDVLQIDGSCIHYIHPSIKCNMLIACTNQLYHIPKSISGYRFDFIKNYEQEKEKLDRMGEYAYYKEIEEICNTGIKNEIAKYETLLYSI